MNIEGTSHSVAGTRRWTRHAVDLPVKIVAVNGILTTPIAARGTDISRAGMTLHAPVALSPGDQMQLQFPTTQPSRVNAVIRNRNGSRLGLEFLSQLPPDSAAPDNAPLPYVRRPGWKARSCMISPQTLYATLHRKQEELTQLRKEIEVLSIAILLLAENENELRNLPTPACFAEAGKAQPLPS